MRKANLFLCQIIKQTVSERTIYRDGVLMLFQVVTTLFDTYGGHLVM